MATRITLMPLTELVELVNEWGTLPSETDGRGRPTGDPELTALADELHPVFAAGDAPARAVQVTALLQATGVRPELTADGGELLEAWTVEDPTQARRAGAALALWHHLAEHQDRIGVCADHQCADVYVDASPAGRRRFCCLTCQNRARAAVFRQRRRESAS